MKYVAAIFLLLMVVACSHDVPIQDQGVPTPVVEPIKNYLNNNATQCQTLRFGCEAGEPFFDDQGCGCMINATTAAKVPKNVTVTFQPLQCVDEPWTFWYKEGHIKFAKEPTDEGLMMIYYGQMGVPLMDIKKVQSDAVVCQACGTCPKSYSFTAITFDTDLEKLPGWTVAE